MGGELVTATFRIQTAPAADVQILNAILHQVAATLRTSPNAISVELEVEGAAHAV